MCNLVEAPSSISAIKFIMASWQGQLLPRPSGCQLSLLATELHCQVEQVVLKITAVVLANADKVILARLFDRLINGFEPVWEFSFDIYSLRPSYLDTAEVEQSRKQNWQDAFVSIAGDEAVLTGKQSMDQLERKGYKPVQAPECLVNAARTCDSSTI
jgi:hypothetical protein